MVRQQIANLSVLKAMQVRLLSSPPIIEKKVKSMINIDWDGVKSLIRWKEPNVCANCNVKVRMLNGTRCKPCHFGPSSGQRKTNPNYFTHGFAPLTIFRKYGVPKEWGKAQLFYFFYYKELNNEFPKPQSILDLNGVTVSQAKIDWILHHMNGENWNDHIWNLILCLRHEHSFFEKMDDVFNKRILDLYQKL